MSACGECRLYGCESCLRGLYRNRSGMVSENDYLCMCRREVREEVWRKLYGVRPGIIGKLKGRGRVLVCEVCGELEDVEELCGVEGRKECKKCESRRPVMGLEEGVLMRLCPGGCGNYVYRTNEEVCGHMHCEACGVHWCWLCRARYDTARECYDHMMLEHEGYMTVGPYAAGIELEETDIVTS